MHLQTVSIGALLEFADGDGLSAGDAACRRRQNGGVVW
jgi:hypothetical protein